MEGGCLKTLPSTIPGRIDMAINLGEQMFAVTRVLRGSDSFVVASEDWLKVETTGVEILNETVPAGKQWRVEVTVKIEESSE